MKEISAQRGGGVKVPAGTLAPPLGNFIIDLFFSYVDRPLLINEAKFDLRFYAYCPSLEPLRIYIYDQGLVRFASIP